MLTRGSILALLFLLCVTSAFAQTDRGTITGRVTDPNGAAVANAKITATNVNTAETREVTTSEDGNYTIPELKADPYKVTAEAQGFKTSSAENIVVGVQVNRTLDFKLEIGEISSVVTITNNEAPVLQTETPVRQTNVTERQVRELPLLVSSEFSGRTPLSFIYLDSNVTQGSGAQGTDTSRFRVSGGQALGTEILIDGATTRRTQNGTFFSEVAPGPNAFQEFTVSTSSYSAEFGNSSGGVVNFTQKSGGNEYHGEVYDLIRNEKLNANTFRSNAQGIDRARDNQNDFGFNIGGPITVPHFGEGGPIVHRFRNRAFFFFNYEGYRFTEGSNNIITVPTLRMRQGDFSELLTDPYILNFFGHGIQLYDPRQPAGSRVPIPGNRLDLYLGGARIDPAVFVTPLYLVNQLYAEHRGDELLATTVDSPTFNSSHEGTNIAYLDATGSRTADGKTIFIKAVNTSGTTALATTITIQGTVPAARAELKTITAPSLSSSNDFSRPDAVSVQTRMLRSGRSFVVTLPKHSVSVIVLTTR